MKSKSVEENVLIEELLRLLTPEEIEKLSYFYHSLNRTPLTQLMMEELEKEYSQLEISVPPPLFEQKKWEKEDPIPPVLPEKKFKSGVEFIIEERRRSKRTIKELEKIRIFDSYNKILSLGQNFVGNKTLARGLILNKKSG